jgi:hypothetical protein
MLRIPTHTLLNYIKAVEPVGAEHVVSFDGGLSIQSLQSSNQIIARISMACNTGEWKQDIGISFPMLKKVLPKAEETVIEFKKDELEIHGTGGHKSTLRTIVPEHCCRQPKKPLVFSEEKLTVNGHAFFEKLSDVESAFDGKKHSKAFYLRGNRGEPHSLYIGDSDVTVGSMETTLETKDLVTRIINESYPYDMVLPVLNAIRHLNDRIDLHFMPMPGGQCNALVIRGMSTDETNRIAYLYVLAPRLL